MSIPCDLYQPLKSEAERGCSSDWTSEEPETTTTTTPGGEQGWSPSEGSHDSHLPIPHVLVFLDVFLSPWV